jgi:hypothetical protein
VRRRNPADTRPRTLDELNAAFLASLADQPPEPDPRLDDAADSS